MQLRPSSLTAGLVLAGVLLSGCATRVSVPDAASTSTGTTSESSSAPISPRISVSQAPVATDPAVDGYPIGQSVALGGGYTVSVDAVDLDATEEMAALVPGLQPTEGRFVLVTITATVTGTEPPLTPTAGLSANLDSAAGFFNRCDGTTDSPLGPERQALPGSPVTWQECIDVPPAAAVPGSRIRVADVFTQANDAFAYWAVA